MGHVRLAVLPRSVFWKDVVALLESDADDAAVVAASARAAEKDMLEAAQGPVFVESVRLLLSVPLAARSTEFGLALREIGLAVRDQPSLIDLVAAAGDRLDRTARDTGSRSDFDELSARALVATLSTSIGDALPGLFDAGPSDVQDIARRFSWSRGISELSRSYFGQLVSGSLSSWLDRTLALQIGEGRRFGTVADRSRFDVALAQLSSEATRIIREFAGGWYGKTIHEKGAIGSRDAAAFGHVALKKIVAELRLRRDPDA